MLRGEAPSEPGLARRPRLRRSFALPGFFIAWWPVNHHSRAEKRPSHSQTPELLQPLTCAFACLFKKPTTTALGRALKAGIQLDREKKIS
jgi:hypothetical protein